MNPKRTPHKPRRARLLKLMARSHIEAGRTILRGTNTAGQWRVLRKLSEKKRRLVIAEKRHAEKLLASVKAYVQAHTYRPRKAAQCAT